MQCRGLAASLHKNGLILSKACGVMNVIIA